jgi:hypothetical protein
MDCGIGGEQSDRRANLNFVVKQSNGLIEVTINSFFSCYVSDMSSMSFYAINDRVTCYSTGLLENEIFEYISKK